MEDKYTSEEYAIYQKVERILAKEAVENFLETRSFTEEESKRILGNEAYLSTLIKNHYCVTDEDIWHCIVDCVKYTYDDIYELADGSACGDPELKRKDMARDEMRYIIQEVKGYDIEETDCAEDEIVEFLEENPKYNVFDVFGHAIWDGPRNVY